MQTTRHAMAAVLGALLLLPACRQEKVTQTYHPAKIDSTEVKGIMRVTLEARAAERIGLETAPVLEVHVPGAGGMVSRSVVPYGALMYDTKGDTWTFTNPQPLVFVRCPVVVESIEGDRVILSEGPRQGTLVVTVGAAELMGAERKYGN